MPIYEYLCQSCGKKFEVLQKFSDEPLLIHPECGGPVEKLISTSALQFKGSGWYVNDYAKGATSKPGETKADSKSDSGKSDSGKSDSGKSDSGKSDNGSGSKSETKTETKTESKPAATESKPAASSPAADSK
jgi:putative FmdB family regulatory protein